MGFDLLQGHDIGVEFANHVGDALGIPPSVPPDAAVDIVGGQPQAAVAAQLADPEPLFPL